MTNLLKLSVEARADWNKEQERIRENQEWQKKALVDKWMQDEAMVENAMLKAINEVSGDMASSIAEDMLGAITILVAQIRKELEEQAEEHLYG